MTQRTQDNDRERRMFVAHANGIHKANEVFAVAVQHAMDTYPDDHDAQFSYLAGLVQGLRRIATRTQNKGVRR